MKIRGWVIQERINKIQIETHNLTSEDTICLIYSLEF